MIGGVSAEDINDDISVDDTIATDNIMAEDISSLGEGNSIVEVDNEKDFEDALNDNNTEEIRLTKDIGLSHSLKVPINHPNLKIDGQNHKIYPNEGFVPQSNGGALYWDSINGCLINCVFDGFNDPTIKNGGAIFWFNTKGVIANCSFINCFATNGGAIYFNHTNSIIQNCSFLNNVATNKGNSIYLNGTGITIDGCKFNQTHEEYSDCEIYISGYCEDTIVSNNIMLSEPPKLVYAAVHMDDLGEVDQWATVTFKNNKFKTNVIYCTGRIYSHINAVFDSKVVKKGETALVKGTVYDDDGNYIILPYSWSIRVNKCDPIENSQCDLFYYFNIPTKDLKPGVYKIESDISDIHNVTDKGNLTVLPYVAPTKFVDVTKGTVYNGKYYSVRLIDSFGNVLDSKKVAIKIAGKTYNVKTDKNGLAKVKLAITSKYIGKSLTVTYKFSGDTDSKASKGSSKIKVIKTPTKIVNATKLVVKNHKYFYVKLTTKAGKVLANKVVTMKSHVSGKTYKIKTNSKGIAKIDLWVKIKPLGKYYKYTFKYAGSNYYKSCQKTFKIKIIK